MHAGRWARVSIPSRPARFPQGHTLKEHSGTGVGEFFSYLLSDSPEVKSLFVSILSRPARSPQGHTLKEHSGTGVGEFFFLLKWQSDIGFLMKKVSIPCIGEFFFLPRQRAQRSEEIIGFNPLHRGIFFLTSI